MTQTETPSFTPVPVQPRHDGWTPERQHAFIEALADRGSVTEAAYLVDMTPESAYRLRRRPDAEAFAEAWEAAISAAARRLADSALERAINGADVAVYYKGELVGYRKVFSARLTMFMLQFLDPVKFGCLHGPLPVDSAADAVVRRIRSLPRLIDRIFGRTPPPEPAPRRKSLRWK